MSDSESPPDRPPPKRRGRKKNSKTIPPHELMTPDIQGPRSSVPKAVFHSQAKWSNHEKRQLLRALRTVESENDITKVYSMVPTRAREEVEAEVLRLRNSVVQHGPDLKAPIETWLDFAEEMVHYEEEDHSKCLARAMSIVSNYETFPTPNSQQPTPDYKALYKYIAAVLSDNEPPKLSPLDSAIILDMMHSLADVISTANTTKQRRVMQWKFSMLNCKVDINNLQDSASRARKALTNVFPDDLFQVKPSNSRKADNQTASGSDEPSTSKQTSTNASSSGTSQSVGQTPQTPVTAQSGTQPGPSDSCPSSAQKDEQVIKQSQTQDLKDNAVKHAPPPGTSSAKQPGTGETTQTGETPSDTAMRLDEDEPLPKKARQRGRPRQSDPPLEKPLLYSLNPFCVPVDILKLTRVRRKRKRMTFKPL